MGHRRVALATGRRHRAGAAAGGPRRLVRRQGDDGRAARQGHLRGVIFSTDDVDATFERISSAGAEVLQEPMDQPYGVRDCAFRDPSGNMLRFNQPR